MAGSTKKIAVIGAGMAGLVSARELQREGHEVVVFEKGHRVGGTWVYDPRVETDLLGLDPDREVVHSSMFESLRVNLPRQLMGFSDYPFVRKEDGDPRSFPRHEEVLRYLEDFGRDFGLDRLVRFGHDVVKVEPVGEAWKEWVVGWRGKEKEMGQDEEIFQAVVVCNGKHTQPRVVDFPGRDTWPGIQMHSHNFRTRDPFINKVVVVIGEGTSALEIINEINGVAKEVHQCRRSSHFKVAELDQVRSWQLHPMIERAEEDGNVVFQDQTIVRADVIIHCTGYQPIPLSRFRPNIIFQFEGANEVSVTYSCSYIFHFPFLRTNGRVTVDDNRIGPLYQHVFPPSMAPGLSFVGFSMLSITSIQARLQAKWVARVLSGKACLPTEKEMVASVEAFYQHLEEASIPKHHTHHIWQDTWEYEKWLIAELGEPPLERWIEELSFPKVVKLFSSLGENYRDTWDVDNWIQKFNPPTNDEM